MRPAHINSYNLEKLQKDIIQYARQHKIHIVAVTKGFDISSIISAQDANLNIIGENRIQEFQAKISNHPHTIRVEKHLIGHLQRNKAKQAIKLFDVIQTVDSVRLASHVNTLCDQQNEVKRIFLQINIGEDPQKHGFSSQNIFSAAEEIQTYKQLRVEGLMTMLPHNQDTKTIRKLYAQTRRIKEKIQAQFFSSCKYLSMGMSNDYISALQEGATHIRLGTLLYGTR